jgi:hypothetical protein
MLKDHRLKSVAKITDDQLWKSSTASPTMGHFNPINPKPEIERRNHESFCSTPNGRPDNQPIGDRQQGRTR